MLCNVQHAAFVSEDLGQEKASYLALVAQEWLCSELTRLVPKYDLTSNGKHLSN